MALCEVLGVSITSHYPSTGNNYIEAVINVELHPRSTIAGFDKHGRNSVIFQTSVATMTHFKRVMEQEIRPVNQILYDALNNRIENNLAKLKPIIKTIVFCGRQNIPLRGHRDDSTYYDRENPGNFQALLDFSGDKVLQEHFETANRNAT